MSADPKQYNQSNPCLGHFIAGDYVDDHNRAIDVMNPATGLVTKQVAMASKETVESAIAAAAAAFPMHSVSTPITTSRRIPSRHSTASTS